jgi:hypothetical protein
VSANPYHHALKTLSSLISVSATLKGESKRNGYKH